MLKRLAFAGAMALALSPAAIGADVSFSVGSGQTKVLKDAGDGTYVDRTFDISNAAFSGVVAMTVGVTYAAQRSVGVLCTVAGNVQLLLSDGSSITLPVSPGWQTFPFAATQIVSAGTTATATYFNLK